MRHLPRWLATAALGLTLACIFNHPVRANADINACFDAVSNAVATVAHAADNLASIASDPNCGTSMANPPLFAAVSAIVTAVNISGAFGGHDYASCNGAISGAIASALLAALTAALDDSSPLGTFIPSDARDPILELAQKVMNGDEVAEQINNVLSALPVIGQMVGMMSCACRISATLIETATDIVETVKSAAECGEFLVSCVTSPASCLGSLFESGIEAIADVLESGAEAVADAADAVANFITCGILDDCPQPKPSPPNQIDCMGGATLAGDVRNYGDDEFIKVSITTNQFCTCGGNLQWSNNNGVWSCGCSAGLVQRWPGQCTCPAGQVLGPGNVCESCPAGAVEQGGHCHCEKENTELMSIGGKRVCGCPPAFREVAGQCVIPCMSVDGSPRVKLGDGSCCDPKQVSACGQCCRTPNCADEKMPSAGPGLSCCPPGQIKVLGGCARPNQVTTSGFVCPLTMILSDGRMDCSRPVRVMRNPPPSRVMAPVRGPSSAVSPGVADCPPGQVLINGRCGFPAGGSNAITTDTKSPGVANSGRDGGSGTKNNIDRFDLGPTFVSPDTSTPGSRTVRGVGSSKSTAASKGGSKPVTSSDGVSTSPTASKGGIKPTTSSDGVSGPSGGLQGIVAPPPSGGIQGTVAPPPMGGTEGTIAPARPR